MSHSPQQSHHPQTVPPQQQAQQPGKESEMQPKPQTAPLHPGSGKLNGRRAVITGGDSGIGRAVAQLMAREGADIAIIYLTNQHDAEEAKALVEKEGRKCVLISGDVGDENFCKQAVEQAVRELGGLDIVVNNAGEQHTATSIEQISEQQLERTYRTNIFGMFFIVKAALPHLKKGASIINTTSVTAMKGNARLLDYSSTKGAIFTFTRSLAEQLADKGIRVNCVAPGPIWTPLIPSSFDPKHVGQFGKNTLMGRPGQPNEVAPAYVYLASDDGSYVTGTVIHVDGGEKVGS